MFAASRRTRVFLTAALFTLSACGGTDAPRQQPAPLPQPGNKPLATLQGQLAPEPGTEVSGEVRLALAWYPALLSEGSGPMSQPQGIVTRDVAYTGSFPANYTFDVTSAPPAEALVELGNGMQGKGAVGVLLAYSDRNGNATLDTIPADGTPVDRVLGASLAWEQPPAFMVIYLDSAQAPATGLKQGFNLVRLSNSLTTDVVPLTTPVPVALRDDRMLDAFVCEAAWDNTAEQAPCGLGEEPSEGLLTLAGEVRIHGSAADVSLDVRREGLPVEGAQVTVGEQTATYDAEQDRYTLHFDDASVLFNSGLVTLTAHAGDEEVTRTVMIPADYRVLSPTAPMSYSPGQAVNVAWTAFQGASYYQVSMAAGDRVLAAEETELRWATLEPQPYEGAATLRIEAVWEEGSGLSVRRVREVPVSFTPCDTATEGSQLTVEGFFAEYDRRITGDYQSEVFAVIKDNGMFVADAKVTLAGWDVPYSDSSGAHTNAFFTLGGGEGLGETVELRAMHGDAVVCRTLTPPGQFDLMLDGPASPRTGTPMRVSWTGSQDAVAYDLRLGARIDQPLYQAWVSGGERQYTFESVDSTGNVTLLVGAIAYPAHNDTLGHMEVKRMQMAGATYTE